MITMFYTRRRIILKGKNKLNVFNLDDFDCHDFLLPVFRLLLQLATVNLADEQLVRQLQARVSFEAPA